MQIPERITSISPAPIDAINYRANQLRREGASVINLGQAVPGFPPVPGAIEHAQHVLEEPSTHIYSADAGLLDLRMLLSRVLAERNGISADPEREIIITAGANQAFLLTLLTLLQPDDKVLLPTPYFLNHEMAIRIAGAIPVEIPLSSRNGFELRLEDLEPYLTPAPRASVIVSPNNPTGAVYDAIELRRIGQACASKNITIIADEVYQHFVYGDSRHFSMASISEIRPHVITIGSFSKTFSLTGWRLGYLVADESIVHQLMKVQDTMIICAPVLSQKVVLGILGEHYEEVERRRLILDQRRRLLIGCIESIPQLSWHPTNGAFFAFVQVQGCHDSVALAKEILDRSHIITIPGRLFGQDGEGYLRLSYGSVNEDELYEACSRLAQHLSAMNHLL